MRSHSVARFLHAAACSSISSQTDEVRNCSNANHVWMIAIATNASACARKRSDTSACARKRRWTKLSRTLFPRLIRFQSSSRSSRCMGCGSYRSVHNPGQPDREGRAATRLALDRNVAAHHLTEAFADREPKACAAVFARSSRESLGKLTGSRLSRNCFKGRNGHSVDQSRRNRPWFHALP